MPSDRPSRILVYVGAYTTGAGQGIYLCEFDAEVGQLIPTGYCASTENPSFLAASPDHSMLYAVNEVGEYAGHPGGAVSAFKIDVGTGHLTHLGSVPSGGGSPCHVAVDATGAAVVVTNYAAGTVAVFPILPDGSLGDCASVVRHQGRSAHPTRQKGPHPHSVTLDPSGRFAFVADLGLDKLMLYRLDPRIPGLIQREPSSVSFRPGAGPRHVDFHPDLRFAYVINEIDSTVTTFGYDAEQGDLTPLQTVSALSGDFTGETTAAHIRVHPSGRFVFGSNRGHDSIVVFAVDGDTGCLSLVGHTPTQGSRPRHFAIDPTGRFLLVANQDGGSVVVFTIDQDSGAVFPTGRTAPVPDPVCVLPLVPGRRLN